MEVDSPPLRGRALTGTAWMVGFRMCSRLIGVASTLVLARLLSTADFGIVAIAFTISAGLNSVSNLGVTETLVRHQEVGRDVLDTGFTVQVIKGLITGGLLILAAPLASAWFDEPRLRDIIYLLAASFTLAGFENVGVIHFRRELRFDLEIRLSAIERVAGALATISSAFLLRNYWALAIGIAVSKLVRVGATYAMHPYRPRFGLKAWHELVGFSLWMWVSSLAYIVWGRADPIVVGSAVSKTELGIFVVALDIALLPTSELLDPIASVLFASFAAERNSGRDPRHNALNVAVGLMALLAPVGIVLSAASTYGVGVLLGPTWSAAAPLVAIMTLSVFLSPFSYTASVVLTALGKLKSNFLVVTTASVAKIALLYIAAQTGNLRVIAAASVTIVSVESAMFIYMLRRNGSQVSGLWKPLFRVAASTCLAALTLYATGLAWAGAVVPPLLECVVYGSILAAVGFGTYALALLGLWAAAGRPDGPERQVLAVVLPGLRRLGRRATTLLGWLPTHKGVPRRDVG